MELEITLTEPVTEDRALAAAKVASKNNLTLGGSGKEFFLSGFTPGDEDSGWIALWVVSLLSGILAIVSEN